MALLYSFHTLHISWNVRAMVVFTPKCTDSRSKCGLVRVVTCWAWWRVNIDFLGSSLWFRPVQWNVLDTMRAKMHHGSYLRSWASCFVAFWNAGLFDVFCRTTVGPCPTQQKLRRKKVDHRRSFYPFRWSKIVSWSLIGRADGACLHCTLKSFFQILHGSLAPPAVRDGTCLGPGRRGWKLAVKKI